MLTLGPSPTGISFWHGGFDWHHQARQQHPTPPFSLLFFTTHHLQLNISNLFTQDKIGTKRNIEFHSKNRSVGFYSLPVSFSRMWQIFSTFLRYEIHFWHQIGICVHISLTQKSTGLNAPTAIVAKFHCCNLLWTSLLLFLILISEYAIAFMCVTF